MASAWIGSSQVVAVLPLEHYAGYHRSLLMRRYGFCIDGGLVQNELLFVREVEGLSTASHRSLLSRLFGLTGLVQTPTLKPDDILLEVNDVKVSGMSLGHVEAFLSILYKRGKPLVLTTARPLHPSPAVYRLTKYVGHCYAGDSSEFQLQEIICDNALAFHPPLTTRPVRDDDGESQGEPYHFLSESQFTALHRSFGLLVGGQYNGYLYGISCYNFAEFSESGRVMCLIESEAEAILKMSKEKSPIKRRRNSFIQALALLPQSKSCSGNSSSPERADHRQVPAAVALRKMGNNAHAYI